MFSIARKFTKTHEWIEYDTDTGHAQMGITNYAQSELGDVVHVDIPSIGTHFKPEDIIICIESVKTAADINSLCEGDVTEINEELENDVSLLNEDPEGKGWIIKFIAKNIEFTDELMT